MREMWMQTARLGFSHWAPEDGGLAQLLWGDGQVTRLICASGRFTEEEIAARLALEVQNEASFGVQYWPVFLLESGELAGCCGLRPHGPDGWELGAHFRPQFWGRGMAFEAAEAVLAYAFQCLGARRVTAGHHPENVASKRLLARLGFTCAGEELYPPTGLLHPSYEKIRRV